LEWMWVLSMDCNLANRSVQSKGLLLVEQWAMQTASVWEILSVSLSASNLRNSVGADDGDIVG
jgi:hypothetical protein